MAFEDDSSGTLRRLLVRSAAWSSRVATDIKCFVRAVLGVRRPVWCFPVTPQVEAASSL